MPKWKAVRVRQELVEEVRKEVEKGQYPSLSEFVSEAIRQRMQTLAKERISEYIKKSRFYTPKHIWVKLTHRGTVELGVSDFFESQLKGIVHVGDLKEGENVFKDEPFGTIETVAPYTFVIHDLYSPIDGMIVKVNKAVIDDPFILNGDPYQWIVEVQPKDPEFDKELDKLLSFEEYTKLITKLGERPRYTPLSDPELNTIIEEINSSA